MAAEKTRGLYISPPDLKAGAGAVREDPQGGRRQDGHHGRVPLDVAAAAGHADRQARSRPTRPSGTRTRSGWTASPSLKRYAEASPAPISASETLGTRWAFRDLLETGAAGVVMLDISWCGGLSEARKIAAMAEAWHLPVAPHDCTGPVVLGASTHLSLNAPNALVQESVRAFYRTWYRDLVTALAGGEERHDHRAARTGPRAGAQPGPRSRLHVRRDGSLTQSTL